MDVQHTPGPWRADAKGGTFDIVAFPNGADYFNRVMVAFTGGGVGIPSEANAALIAAAPDLLAALEEVLPYVEHAGSAGFYDEGGSDLCAEKIRAAIAKARLSQPPEHG